jgi:hypothetical protein
MFGALAARALGIVCELGVAEALDAGGRPVSELAREVGADGDALYRLLRALAGEEVFAEVAPGVFANTEASSVLCRREVRDTARVFGGVFHRAAGELRADGEASFERTFETDFWDWLAAHPEQRAVFDSAMVEGLERRLERLCAVEWRGDELVCDVGGGNGSLLRALLERYPGMRGIVFDLPETVRDEESLGERIEFVSGSFFEGIPTADMYILATILHDWPDEPASAILKTIATAAPEHARLVALEAVIPTGDAPHGSKWLDLLMLALFAGRERTEQQWRTLFENSSFAPTRIEDGLIEATRV